MHHAAQTYGAIAKKTANPRELEADLLLTAAARLQAIRDSWESKRTELDAALLYNRKLWSIFVTSATSTENSLPVGLRQNVANIGLFVAVGGELLWLPTVLAVTIAAFVSTSAKS